MDLLWEGTSLFNEPPAVEPQDAYEIGFADGRKELGRRDTFMLHRWGAEQQRYYDRGYKDGQTERLAVIQQASRSYRSSYDSSFRQARVFGHKRSAH